MIQKTSDLALIVNLTQAEPPPFEKEKRHMTLLFVWQFGFHQ